MTSLDTNFTVSLYRPYLDLAPSPLDLPSINVQSIEMHYKGLEEGKDHYRVDSHTVMTSFRRSLVRQTGWNHVPIYNPMAMPNNMLNDRYMLLIGYIENFDKIFNKEKVRIARILHKMAFFQFITELYEAPSDHDIASDPEIAELALIRAQAKFILFKEGLMDYSLGEMERVATLAPTGSQAKVNATYQMVSQTAKTSYQPKQIVKWLKLHLDAISESQKHNDKFQYQLHLTRYYRALAFIPQINNDGPETVRIMDRCEQIARRLMADAKAPDEKLAAQFQLYGALESRIKEALWLEQLPTAERRAIEMANHLRVHPRGFLTLGQVLLEQGKVEKAKQAYQKAIWYSPQGIEIAAYMLGQCYQATKNNELALDYYMMSLKHDPKSVSALKKATNLADMMGKTTIHQWCIKHGNELSTKGRAQPRNTVKKYQHKQFNKAAA